MQLLRAERVVQSSRHVQDFWRAVIVCTIFGNISVLSFPAGLVVTGESVCNKLFQKHLVIKSTGNL